MQALAVRIPKLGVVPKGFAEVLLFGPFKTW